MKILPFVPRFPWTALSEKIKGETLDLSDYETTDLEIFELSNILLEPSCRVKHLNLSKIGRKKLEILLPSLQVNKSIETLDLSQNDIVVGNTQQSSIINDLCYLLQNGNLKKVNLNNNGLRDEDINFLLFDLKDNKNLQEIQVLNNMLSNSAKQKIAESQAKIKCVVKFEAELAKQDEIEKEQVVSIKKMRVEVEQVGDAINNLKTEPLLDLLNLPDFPSPPPLDFVSESFQLPSVASFSQAAQLDGLKLHDFSSAKGSFKLEGFAEARSKLSGLLSCPALGIEQANSKEQNSVEEDSTLADGNCAFNSVVLGVCDLLKNDKIRIQPEFQAMIAEKFSAEVKQHGEVVTWLKQERDTIKLQKLLSPILRNLAVSYIQRNLRQFSDTYEQGLKSAFKQYCTLGEKDETYAVHPHIFAQFQMIKKQYLIMEQLCKSENEKEMVIEQFDSALINWWKRGDANAKESHESGMQLYFKDILQSAQSASDAHTWGSEVEIDALAKFFAITIKNKKPQRTQILGCASGIVLNLTPNEVSQLNALAIGSMFGNSFRIESDRRSLQNILDLPRLSPVEIAMLDEKNQKEILEYKNNQVISPRYRHAPHLLKTVCEKLERIGALYYRQNPGGIVMDFVSPQRLALIIQPIPEALKKKVWDVYKNDIPSFTIKHAVNHWSYILNEPNPTAGAKRKLSLL